MRYKIIDDIFDWALFDTTLEQNSSLIPQFRSAIKQVSEALIERFNQGDSIQALIFTRAWFMDQLLNRAWQHFLKEYASTFALIAVGGYGRHELHPGSDIDILILIDNQPEANTQEFLELFLTFTWDIGLEVGHSVRTIDDCIEQGLQDITIATNLMESRLIHGSNSLFETLQNKIGQQEFWTSKDFFSAKLKEQIARHHRYGDTAYNLEPNIKENPGGLRDIQVIGWVAKRHFGATSLNDLVDHQFLTQAEFETLEESQNFLWRIRFGLHIIAGRREDRLLFDHQRSLAQQFAYIDNEEKLAVEQFMKDYYCTVLELNRLNEMLLQLFDEEILSDNEKITIKSINNRFQSRNDFLEVKQESVFKRTPFALLEIFLVLTQNNDLKGVRAETIRLIRNNRYLINEQFRNDVRCHSLFMEIFRQPKGLTHELRRMNRYGVLAEYLPEFGKIVGQMQHDLFHVYTVDEHTMFLVRNLRRFTVTEFAHEFPLCSKIIKSIPKPELLYLAGFYHDIAKGRGGDHSELGAVEAINFCLHHGISRYDSNLIAWLVKNHLVMSTTAQRKDISDAEVINQFAEQVGTQERLNYLYLLTVADIRATSPRLWNSWKDSLLAELYRTTSKTFRRGLEAPLDQTALINENKALAATQLEESGIQNEAVQNYWESLEQDYFVRYSVDEVVWHSRLILDSPKESFPLIEIRTKTHRGGTELFACTYDDTPVFAIITTSLEKLGVNIIDARISTSELGYTLQTFIFLEKSGDIISTAHRVDEIKQALQRNLSGSIKDLYNNNGNQSMPRQLKHFPIHTEVLFHIDNKDRSVVEIITGDQPGLLAKIAYEFLQHNIRIKNAKIATFGEKVEDIFFITDKNDKALVDTLQQNELRKSLIERLT